MSLRSRLLLMVPLVLTLVALDQLSKQWAVENLANHPPRTYGNILRLVYTQNAGAWGSLGAKWGDAARSLLLNFLPAGVLLALMGYTLFGKEVARGDVLATALIVGGGLGNLIDRFRMGFVTDFLYLGVGRIGTNIFNLGDVAIVTGVAVFVYQLTRTPAQETATG